MERRFSCCFYARKLSRKRDKNTTTSDVGLNSGEMPREFRTFTYNELKSATTNFHRMNRIGSGGFGEVHKGTLRDGTQIAIKSLSAKSAQGINEFLTEIDMVSKIRHPNLVRLVGCCVEGLNRILVYEYMENNSLAKALFGIEGECIPMDWSKRAAICLGTAQGLLFLHEEAKPRIVHRDIKASNILLDKYLLPKIGDFGLAKLFPDCVTHISTRVAGTIGYLAPEYALLGQLTKKADIYSFGVLILEIISGCSSSNSAQGLEMKLLLEWAWMLRDEERLLELVDPELQEFPEVEVLRFIKVALLCTQAASVKRPSMNQVMVMLSSDSSLDVKDLVPPGVVRTADHSSSGDPGSSGLGTSADTVYAYSAPGNISGSLIEMQPR